VSVGRQANRIAQHARHCGASVQRKRTHKPAPVARTTQPHTRLTLTVPSIQKAALPASRMTHSEVHSSTPSRRCASCRMGSSASGRYVSRCRTSSVTWPTCVDDAALMSATTWLSVGSLSVAFISACWAVCCARVRVRVRVRVRWGRNSMGASAAGIIAAAHSAGGTTLMRAWSQISRLLPTDSCAALHHPAALTS
jgi:hypothetical protein